MPSARRRVDRVEDLHPSTGLEVWRQRDDELPVSLVVADALGIDDLVGAEISVEADDLSEGEGKWIVDTTGA